MPSKRIDPGNTMGKRILIFMTILVGLAGIGGFVSGVRVFAFEGLHRYGGWWAGISGIITSAYFIVSFIIGNLY